MAETASRNIELGTKAPYFKLIDTVTGKMVDLNDYASKNATVIMFICNHCPYVKHINPGIVNLANDYIPKGVGFLAINPNDIKNYPEDSPENMKLVALALGYKFPYIYDETQEVAKAYYAACTPEFYVFDGKMELAYHGQFDSARPGNAVPVTGNDVRQALEAVIAGRPVSSNQSPGIGCSIKWKK